VEVVESRAGTYVVTTIGGEAVRAFVPPPLPPRPPVVLDGADQDLLEQANRAVGRLDGLATVLPDTSVFVYMYVRKEAVLSSQIEGTQSSLSDLLAHEIDEAPGVPFDDVVEVSSYVAAMDHGLRRMREGFPLSLRLLCEIHGILLADGRGAERGPGEFRRSQNWIGGSRPGTAAFVPPPPDRLMDCLDNLEKFLHDQPQRTPLLIKTALAHAQFETIHPFLDGNGRLGRLLITLLLCAEEALIEPILYLSLHFKANRQEYYERLQRVRTEGDWEGWLRFFLEGVRSTSKAVVDTARATLALFDADRRRIQTLGRPAGSVLQVHDVLERRPVLSVAKVVAETGLSPTTVSSAFARMVDLGLAREITGRRRDRLFAYGAYLDLLSEGTEPLSR
jgi:Fic family protein